MTIATRELKLPTQRRPVLKAETPRNPPYSARGAGRHSATRLSGLGRSFRLLITCRGAGPHVTSLRWVLASSPLGAGQAWAAPIVLGPKKRKRRSLGNLPAPWAGPEDCLGGRRNLTIPAERSEGARHGVEGAPRWTNVLKDAVLPRKGRTHVRESTGFLGLLAWPRPIRVR